MLIHIIHALFFVCVIIVGGRIVHFLRHERNIAKLVEHAKIGYVKFRYSDGTVLDINKGMCEILGIDLEKHNAQGLSIDEFMVAEPGHNRITEEARLHKGVVREKVYTFRTLGGQEKCVLINFLIHKDLFMGYDIVHGLLEDITNEKEFYREMLESEEKYEKLFVNSGDMVILYSPENVIEEVNPVTEIILGYTRDKIVGAAVDTILHPASRDLFKERQRALLLGGAEYLDIVFVGADGEYRQGGMTMSLFEFKGKTKYMAVVNDLTEFVKEKEELKRRRNELENICEAAAAREERINELKNEIQTLQQRLDEARAQKQGRP